ncbi:MAG: methylated-DNA--[protein]-cysteine S-methyltransferase [Deltaproteobacteria bacterium]|nr:methylated-DNA--[protein]-cysteine S-methyltransferase [Deltaproteobacteria bacterium]
MNQIQSSCHYYNKKIGWLKLIATNQGLTDIAFVEPPRDSPKTTDSEILKNVIEEFDHYFQGKSSNFLTPIEFTTGTSFERKVWMELMKIPLGETRSYGQIATAVGNAQACRAVGSANGKNPVPIIVPCHRVIRSDGTLGGYSSGVHIKKALLEHEKNCFVPIPD